jgi:ribosomal protein S18 acetylase RimI-like enzyme
LWPEANGRCAKTAGLSRWRFAPVDKTETMNVEIQTAQIEDAAAILALQKLAYRSEGELNQDWSIPPLVQTQDEICAEFRRLTFLKAERAGEIVGSVRAEQSGDTCAIGRLMMHPSCQRQGIGGRLMQAIEARFPAARRYELFTGEKSAGNIPFYERLGYRIFRRERLSEKVMLVFMEKIAPARS